MRNRSREELEGILQAFPDVFEEQMGTKLTAEKMREILLKKLKEKEEFLINQRFLDFDPRSIRTMLELLNDYVDKSVETVEKPKRKKRD